MSKQHADCPACGRSHPVRADGLFYCTNCQALYDDDPNEGGAWCGNNPVVNVSSREEFEIRQRAREQRRQRRRW